jgi:hypothetical protein
MGGWQVKNDDRLSVARGSPSTTCKEKTVTTTRHRDPTPAEIEQLCAEIRRRWPERVEREHRVQHVSPVVFAAVEDIGLEWQSMSL